MGEEWDQGRNQKVSGNKWKWTHNTPKLLGQSKGSPEREVHSDTGLLKKKETVQINNLTLYLQELEEQKQTNPRASRRKEITKIKAELNDLETKSTILRNNKSRSLFFEKINKIDKPLQTHQEKKREDPNKHN